MKNFFEKPTQVAFLDNSDAETPRYIAGIAHGCFITCLECGGVIEIDELIADAAMNFPSLDPIIPLPWIDLSPACLGDLAFDQ